MSGCQGYGAAPPAFVQFLFRRIGGMLRGGIVDPGAAIDVGIRELPLKNFRTGGVFGESDLQIPRNAGVEVLGLVKVLMVLLLWNRQLDDIDREGVFRQDSGSHQGFEHAFVLFASPGDALHLVGQG